METLLKNRKYFDYLKANKRILTDSQFDEVRSANASGFETIVKLQRSILAKLEGEHEDLDKPTSQGFDLSKLEAMKEKTNKNFFEDMNKIKAAKGGAGKGGAGKAGPEADDDLLGLGEQVGDTRPQAKVSPNDIFDLQGDLMGMNLTGKPAISQPKPANKDDFLDLGFGGPAPTNTQPNPHQKTSNYAHFDMLDLAPPSGPKIAPPANDPLLNFGHPAPAKNPAFDLNFASSDLFLGETKREADKPKPPSQSDPFNFIVF